MKWLATLQLASTLFDLPITSAYAVQWKKDVMVSVTYTTEKPRIVCTEVFPLEDHEMLMSTDSHCWSPKDNIGDIDVWENQDINNVNFRVTVQYPSGEIVVINLTAILNT